MDKEQKLALQKRMRNFSIIAHIDHGKSTLADRILEATGTVSAREMKTQLLDSMDLERERGITIKLNAVQLKYHATDGVAYTFHLIDTPGHVDFTYEVSRSLAACEGALLVVDAAQGVEAQTLANVYLALDNDLTIIPVLNKIDLPSADPDRVKAEIEAVIGLPAERALYMSAKSGLGIDAVLEAIVREIPAPSGDPEAPVQALIFDSYFDPYRGVVISLRVKVGTIKVGDTIKFMATAAEYEVTELGINTPKEQKKQELIAGEVGWLSAAIKTIQDVQIGDTITTLPHPAQQPLAGYKQMKPMVFAGLYPVDNSRYEDLKEALRKLQLSDASLTFEPETSQALGFGFRCGFLGLLHMEIIEERLEREFSLALIATAPSVIYHVHLTDGTSTDIDNPAQLPPLQRIDYIEEPYVKATIMAPATFVGPIMELAQSKRGVYQDMSYLNTTRVQITYTLPLAEIVYDFFDKLKSRTKGYASFDYELAGYQRANLVKMDILLNGEVLDALSIIVHRDFAYQRGKLLTEKLKDIIPQHQFEIPIQAAIGGKIIARSTIKALRKNVLAKCYGGDISRKRKLLEKQKQGKKRMKAVGNVEVPQAAFMAVLSMDDDE